MLCVPCGCTTGLTIPMKNYSELSKLQTFEERFRYLQLGGDVGTETFGSRRFANQTFYKSPEWRSVRNQVIIRDNGCDLGVEGYSIYGKILIHHINPISIDDILQRSDLLLNPENLICVTHGTHNAIHYGDESLLMTVPQERTKNDTCPWKH